MSVGNAISHRVAIVGVTGYAGRELDALLGRHPLVGICARFASKDDDSAGAAAFELARLHSAAPDLTVFATDHEFSIRWVPQLLDAGYRVLDMSGAFRLKDPRLYPQWYGFEHPCPSLLAEAAYGLPELFPEPIRRARLVANPGCYATAAILPLFPLFVAGAVDVSRPVVVDGKSGVSGAGKKPTARTHFCEVNENIQAYGVFGHPHTPEMVSSLPNCRFDRFVFTPHLIPIDRGILNTIVFSRTDGISPGAVLSEAYAGSPFVHVLPEGSLADVHGVVRTNFCHISAMSDGDTVILLSAIDNLGKGAAGQAVQNLNVMLGSDPALGLRS